MSYCPGILGTAMHLIRANEGSSDGQSGGYDFGERMQITGHGTPLTTRLPVNAFGTRLPFCSYLGYFSTMLSRKDIGDAVQAELRSHPFDGPPLEVIEDQIR